MARVSAWLASGFRKNYGDLVARDLPVTENHPLGCGEIDCAPLDAGRIGSRLGFWRSCEFGSLRFQPLVSGS